MVCQLKRGIRTAFQRAEDNSAVPEAAFDNVITVFGDSDRLIKPLDVSVCLIHTSFVLSRVEFELLFTAEREGYLGVLVVGPREPHEALSVAFFLRTHNLAFLHEPRKHDCFLGYQRLLLGGFLLLTGRHRFKHFELAVGIYDQVKLQGCRLRQSLWVFLFE